MILLRHLITCIVCRDYYVNPIVRIRPSGMVIRLGDKWSGVLHELHRFFESAEFECFLKGLIGCLPGGHRVSQGFHLVLNRLFYRPA